MGVLGSWRWLCAKRCGLEFLTGQGDKSEEVKKSLVLIGLGRDGKIDRARQLCLCLIWAWPQRVHTRAVSGGGNDEVDGISSPMFFFYFYSFSFHLFDVVVVFSRFLSRVVLSSRGRILRGLQLSLGYNRLTSCMVSLEETSKPSLMDCVVETKLS